MAANPFAEYSYENWLEGSSGIKWEDVGDYYQKMLIDKEITQEEFDVLEREGLKVYEAQRDAFEKLAHYNCEVFIADYLFRFRKVDKKNADTYRQIEIESIEKYLNSQPVLYQQALEGEQDFDGLDGNTYKKILSTYRHWKDTSNVFNEITINENNTLHSKLKYLDWLRNNKPVDNTLEAYFLGHSREFSIIMNLLVNKKITVDETDGILKKEGDRYWWTYRKYGSKNYLIALVYTLKENGWLDLTDDDEKVLSNQKLAMVISKTFGQKVSKETAAIIRNGAPKEKYLLPFKDIPKKK